MKFDVKSYNENKTTEGESKTLYYYDRKKALNPGFAYLVGDGIVFQSVETDFYCGSGYGGSCTYESVEDAVKEFDKLDGTEVDYDEDLSEEDVKIVEYYTTERTDVFKPTKEYKLVMDNIQVDANMEENYGFVKVIENGYIVGEFQMYFDGVMSEAEVKEELVKLNPNELMSRQRREDAPRILRLLHRELMISENSCLYGDDMEGWINEEMDMEWDEFKEELKASIELYDGLEDVIEFGESQFIVFANYHEFFNLHNKIKKCPTCGTTLDVVEVLSGENMTYEYNPKSGLYEYYGSKECLTIVRCENGHELECEIDVDEHDLMVVKILDEKVVK